jgi:mannose-6-phosphate isomerase-like protein (cupin superfamily)
MDPHRIRTLARELPELRIGPDTTEEEAFAAMRMLGSFNQCLLGMARFSGQTPWEWHPDDELLCLVEGEVEVTLLPAEGGPATITVMAAGDILIVPRRTWHRQFPRPSAALVFVTSSEGNRHSETEDPRETA